MTKNVHPHAWLTVTAAATMLMASAAAHATKYEVSDANGLLSALGKVVPGDVIVLAPGTYRGSFVATRSGAKGNPITLKGPSSAVLTNSGYGFSLKANYWKLTGFTVDGASKGIVLDNARNNLLDKLTVKNVGGEGIHFRTFSSDNVLRNSTVRDTGKDTPGYGEGVYAGSAVSNWDVYTDGKPDTSDRNCIANNHIGPGVTAEGIDLKEGTTGGIVVGNTYDATGISGENYGDSFIDAKGNGYHIYGNQVSNPGRTKVLKDGFQTHVAYTGYGKDNIFQANTVDLQSTGYGFYITTSGTGNKVCSDNSVSHADSGVANISTVSCSNPKPICPKVLNLPLR
ncbi:right-handed parallel beta-helix repeat-containing protein [Ideonella sp. DXS29W]|uniref:Right-handed parallel beta-helix repeat-containing protein n=1 Tax=Ideonella lacteola TaxID=2984193 RepID=A0ABU9BNL2_9BURK